MGVMDCPSGSGDAKDGRVVADTRDPDRGLRTFNAHLIATYRIAAPKLAREVVRLRGATTTVEYRPGLPTAEQVQAHEARGGVWMTLVEGRASIDRMHVDGAGRVAWTTLGGAPLGAWMVDERFSARPCLPDGTPCQWP